jgi:hypothetical protein
MSKKEDAKGDKEEGGQLFQQLRKLINIVVRNSSACLP